MQAQVVITEQAANSRYHAVEQSDHGNKCKQHGADVQGQRQAGQCAVTDRFEDVDRLCRIAGLYVFDFDIPIVGFRFDDLGHQQPARCGHKAGRDQVLEVNPHRGVAGHDGAGDGRAATCHDGE